MKIRFIASFLLAGILLLPLYATAGPIRTFVSPFTVTPQEAAGLREPLQRILASRIAGDGISTVDSADEAEVIVNGSYTRIGKMFSVDAAAKLAGSTQTVATAFAQGESQDDLIPALGTVASKLRAEMVQRYPQLATAPKAPKAPAPTALPAPAAAAPVPAAPEPVRAQEQPTSPSSAKAPQAAEPQQSRQGQPAGSPVWMSQRISGAQTSIAPGATSGGARALFVADGNHLRAYRQEKTLALVTEAEIPAREKVIAVDSIEQRNGSVRVYLSVMDDDSPSSRVYSFENGKLKLVGDKLPYLFRALSLKGGPPKIYAQQIGRVDDFFGDVFELSEAGGKFQLVNPIRMPRFGNVYNFNMFSDAAGKNYFTVFSSDGYLIVYSDSGEELYRSTDKLGGSATFFKRAAQATGRMEDELVKWHFIDQRITVTPKGEIIVPRNEGFFVIGNNRSYSKYSFSGLAWNGSYLEERWKTKVAPNYLADYFYAPDSAELVLLEVVQKEGMFGKGASAVRVIRAE